MRSISNNTARGILLGVILLVFPSLTTAQQPAPKPATLPDLPKLVEPTVGVSPLSPENQQLADQYIDAIEQLENTIDDYVIYFGKFSPEKLRAHNISFETFANGIESGLYCQNPSHLSNDLDEYIDLLRSNERSLRSSSDLIDKKLFRRVRSLRRELAVILDLIEDAIIHREGQKAFEENLQAHISRQLKEFEIRISRLGQEAFARQYEQAIKNYLESLEILSESSREESLESLGQLEALKGLNLTEDIEVLIRLSLEQQMEVLKALESVEIEFTRDNEPVIVYTHKKRHGSEAPIVIVQGTPKTDSRKYRDSNVRFFSGTLGISSDQRPVYITHPRGELRVTGWNEAVVSAELYVVVEARTAKARDDFLESVRLKMGQDKDGYFAETVFPRLTNPNTKVVESILTIKVPSRNRVICNHSFGEVMVERFNHGALVKGNNSSIIVRDIKGRLKIENSLGPISLDRIDGSVQITNSFGQIFISECSARGKVMSSSGLISLADSEGSFNLVNSGPINVVDHNGNIDIENSGGTVTLLNIVGNVSAYNTLQPIIAQNIEGEVILENRNADIKVYQISESLDARTSHGNIEAGWIGEQFDLKIDHGNIALELGTTMRGTSKVSSISGQIALIVSPEADILMTAQTSDGSISSDFPMELSDDGPTKSARIKIGNGSNRLVLKAIHGSIKIEEL